MFGIVSVIIGVVLVGWLILKKFYAPWALLMVGLILLTVVGIGSQTPLLTNKTATNTLAFDIVQVIHNVSKSTLAGLGLQIMIISGFANYLDRIGATKTLVNICAKPLAMIRAPYILLGVAYVVGQIVNIFIPSAVGLGVLMMLTVFPLLMAVGVSRVSAAAVIVTMSCLDLGPGSANSIVTAKLSGITAMEYFVESQIPVAIVTVIAISVAHVVLQKWFDKRDLEAGRLTPDDFKLAAPVEATGVAKQPDAPLYYAILPVLPIVLLFVFSKFCITTVRLQLETAILACILIAFLTDLATHRDFKDCVARTKTIFTGMGKVFTTTVALIICAGVFAEGLKVTGGLNTIIGAAASFQNAGGFLMLFVMCAILMVAAVVTGSANAAFFAFSSLIPEAAKSVAWQTVVMACPVQLVSGIARSMSPIAGVAMAVSSIAGVSPFAVVRRTIPVMVIGAIATVVSSLVFIG